MEHSHSAKNKSRVDQMFGYENNRRLPKLVGPNPTQNMAEIKEEVLVYVVRALLLYNLYL